MAGSANATVISYQTTTNAVVATTSTFVIDMSANVIDLFSAQAVFSSATPSASTFNDGRVSTATITVVSTTGVLGAYLNVGGTVLKFGVDIATAATPALLATNIATAMNANSTLNTAIVSTAAFGSSTVYSTSTAVGLRTLYYLFSSSPSTISTSGPNYRGGLDSAISGSVISLPSHGLTTGQAVLYSTGSGVTVQPLTNQTTYYVIAVDANHVELSTTAAQSLAGTFITLLSPSITGPHSFTVTPLALSGVLTLTWQASNDSTNWSNLNLTQLSFSTPFATENLIWDFGAINFKYIRAQVTGPTNGAANFTLSGYGKTYSGTGR